MTAVSQRCPGENEKQGNTDGAVIDASCLDGKGAPVNAVLVYNCLLYTSDTPVLYLELGVGMNTPGIIKYNFWQQVYKNPKAKYACINKGQSYAPREIADRSICLDIDAAQVLIG